MNLKTYREMKCLFFLKMLEIITKIVRKTRNNREEQGNRFCTYLTRQVIYRVTI